MDAVLLQVGVFALLLGLGMLTVRTGVLDSLGLDRLNRLTLRIVLPVLIFDNIALGVERRELGTYLGILLPGLIMLGTLFLLGLLLARLPGISPDRRRSFRFLLIFGNMGLLGLPLISALFPARGKAFAAVYSVAEQLLIWTAGAAILMGGEKISLRKLASPNLISAVLAVCFVLLDLPIPTVVEEALGLVGGCTLPLSLLYIGGWMMANGRSGTIRPRELCLTAALRLLLAPLVAAAVLYLLGVDPEIRSILTVVAALPSPVAASMILQENGGDPALANSAVTVTTLACLVTLPAVLYLTEFLFR